jgi:hypothetical protein
MPIGIYIRKKKGKDIKCRYCNKKFYISLNSSRQYCSRICYWKDLKNRMIGKNNPFYKKTHNSKYWKCRLERLRQISKDIINDIE